MEQAESHNKEEDLEEGLKDVRCRIAQKDEGQKGGEATIPHSGTDVYQSFPDSLIAVAFFDHETVGDVSGVIDAKPDGKDEVDAGDCVNCKTPEMHKSSDID